MVLTLSLLIWLAERARQQLAGACQRAIRRPGDWKWLLHEPTNYPHVKFRVSAVLIRCFYPVFTAPAQLSPARPGRVPPGFKQIECSNNLISGVAWHSPHHLIVIHILGLCDVIAVCCYCYRHIHISQNVKACLQILPGSVEVLLWVRVRYVDNTTQRCRENW